MNNVAAVSVVPRWLLVGIAICILVPDLTLMYQLTPAFRHSHQINPAIKHFWGVQGNERIMFLAAELLRPSFSLFLAFRVSRGRWLNVAAIYLGLRIVVPLVLVWMTPQVFGWPYAPILFHVLALAGVIQARRRLNAPPAAAVLA